MTKHEVLRSIRRHCVDCMGGDENYLAVTSCPSSPREPEEEGGFPGCHLWPFRMGKDPSPSKSRSESAKARFGREGRIGVKDNS